ncbi:MAG: PsbP-related protein, partial [Promethearchaeota archaeon]
VTNVIKKVEEFKQTQTEIYKQTPEMQAMAKPFMDLTNQLFYSGLNPEVAAEMVIKAIEEDIFYIVTHPEYLLPIKSRFEKLESDTIKLHECLGKCEEDLQILKENDLTTATYEHKSPAFSISFPSDWKQVKPVPTPVLKQVFLALAFPNYELSISISKKSQEMVLENTSKELVRYSNTIGNDTRIISSQQTQLKDGTPANETVIEYLRRGFYKYKILCVTVFSDNKIIRIIVSSVANCYREDLKKIVYSLELK